MGDGDGGDDEMECGGDGQVIGGPSARTKTFYPRCTHLTHQHPHQVLHITGGPVLLVNNSSHGFGEVNVC